MAIDTREKRQSVVGISYYFVGPNVTPNAAKDVEWRQEAGWGYPGILPSGLIVTAGRQQHILMHRGHRRGIGGMNMCW